MDIGDLDPHDERAVGQAAAVLAAGFQGQAWPTLESALIEVRKSLDPDRLSRVARDEHGAVVGWIGGIRQYNGHVWEIHPLVVRPDQQGRGIGRALVLDLEECVRRRGGITLWLGTDDVFGQTTLSGVTLYPDIWTHIAAIRNLARHPYGFYEKLGFVIVGVMPDANGIGKPDIHMAKRVNDLPAAHQFDAGYDQRGKTAQ